MATHVSRCGAVQLRAALLSPVLQAFLEPYKHYAMFRDANNGLSLEEFADAREVVADLSAEYEACEHADYVSRPSLNCGSPPDLPRVYSSHRRSSDLARDDFSLQGRVGTDVSMLILYLCRRLFRCM